MSKPAWSKLLGYSFKVEWIPGKNHVIADIVNIEDMALAELSRIASEDKDYQEVVDIVLSRKYEGKLLRTLNKQHPAHQYSAQWDWMSDVSQIPRTNDRSGSRTPESAYQFTPTTHRQVQNTSRCMPVIFLAGHDRRHWPHDSQFQRMHFGTTITTPGTANTNCGHKTVRTN